jgi:hypothetical protein
LLIRHGFPAIFGRANPALAFPVLPIKLRAKL